MNPELKLVIFLVSFKCFEVFSLDEVSRVMFQMILRIQEFCDIFQHLA